MTEEQKRERTRERKKLWARENRQKKKSMATVKDDGVPELPAAKNIWEKVESLASATESLEKNLSKKVADLEESARSHSELENKLAVKMAELEASLSAKISDLTTPKPVDSPWTNSGLVTLSTTSTSTVFYGPANKAVDLSSNEASTKKPGSSATGPGWTSIGSALKYLFILACVTAFTGFTVYLQQKIYADRGYTDILSWAFAGFGEIALLTIIYFLKSAHTRGHRVYLRGILGFGSALIAFTLGNGAYQKISSEKNQRDKEVLALKNKAKTDYDNAVFKRKTVIESNQEAARNHKSLVASLSTQVEDRKSTRDKYLGKDFSTRDRRQAEGKLTKAEDKLTSVKSNPPVAQPVPPIPTMAEVKQPTEVDQLSHILQVLFQLFIFSASLGLTALLPTISSKGNHGPGRNLNQA